MQRTTSKTGIMLQERVRESQEPQLLPRAALDAQEAAASDDVFWGDDWHALISPPDNVDTQQPDTL